MRKKLFFKHSGPQVPLSYNDKAFSEVYFQKTHFKTPFQSYFHFFSRFSSSLILLFSVFSSGCIKAKHLSTIPASLTSTTVTTSVQNLNGLTLVSPKGEGQSSIAGVAFPTPLTITVQDSNGSPVAGQLVAWSLTSGNGTLSAYSSITNVNGVAS